MKFLRNVKGFSLIEGLMAAAILAIGVSAITLYIVQSAKNTVGLQGNSLCQTRAEMIIQTFKNGDNKANISNWVYSGGSTTPSLPGTYHPEIEMYGIVVNPATVTSPFPVTSSSFTNGWELIDNGTNWALSLVKNDSSYCQLTGNQYGHQILSSDPHPSYSIFTSGLAPPPSTLTNEADYLNIALVDTLHPNNPPQCPGGTYSRIEPLSTISMNDPSAGANFAIQIAGTVTYTDTNQVLHQCQATTKLKPDGDNTAPTFVSPALMPAGPTVYCGTGTTPGNGLNMCFSGSLPPVLPVPPSSPAIACNTTSLQVAFQSSEAGSVFTCDLEYATTEAALPATVNLNNNYLCGQGTYNIGAGGSVSLAVTPFTGAASLGSGELVTVPTSIEGFYRLFVTIYDSAQNSTTESLDIGVDNNRPGAGFAIAAPSPFIATFNGTGGAAVRSHVPVSSPWDTAVSFETNLFQCEDSLSTDNWTASGGETTPVSQVGAVWSYTANGGAPISLGGGKCVPQIQSPSGLDDGTYVMQGYGCDACGMATPTPAPVTQTWYVDEAPAPTPGHSPIAPPASDFGTAATPLPSWTLSVAKPTPDQFQYACQNVASPTTYSSQTTTCTPTGFVGGQPCSSQGSTGFCANAFDGCGRNAADTNTPYEIMAGLGQSCCNVPCRSDISLICAMDNSASNGTCVPQTPCALDSDCGAGSTCYLPMGICHGAGSGPAPQTCGATPVPTPVPTPTATPVLTPPPTPTPTPSGGCICNPPSISPCPGDASSCSGIVYSDSCGNLTCQYDLSCSCQASCSGSPGTTDMGSVGSCTSPVTMCCSVLFEAIP